MSLNALLSIFFICLSSFMVVPEKGNSQTTSEVTVTLNKGKVKLKDVFSAIQAQSAFKFFYDRNLLGTDLTINISNKTQSVADALTSVSLQTGLVFKQINQTISVKEDRLRDTSLPMQKGLVQTVVTGQVIDTDGKGLPGVSVKVKGEAGSTSTDPNGKYSISVSSENSILVFSYVGFLTTEQAVGSSGILNITLKEQQNNLNELVVIGYGTQKKADITSAVTSVKSENFVKGAVKDAGQLLQGKVAGLAIATPSGDPTASTQILLRGTATLGTSVQPLILIDGIPGDLNTVAPEDVESMDVLKDGSAAAIYGTRGTNGVILITTKKPGGNMEPTIDYNGYVSTQSFTNLPSMLNAATYKEKLPTQDLGSNTDWIKEVSRGTPLSNGHNFSLRGGNSKTSYVATMGYRYFQGIFLKSDNRLMNGRIDVNHNMFDNKLKINVNILNTDTKYNSLGNGTSFNNTIFRQVLGRNPTAPIRNPDGTWQEQTAIAGYENPLALLNESYGENQSQATRLSGSVTWVPIKELQLKALVSRNKLNSDYGYAETKNHISTIRDGRQGFATKNNGQAIDNLVELSALFSKSVNLHNFSALAGYSYQDNTNQSGSIQNQGFPAGNFSYIDNIGIGSALGNGLALINSSKFASNLIGFFGRLTYNYDEKYLLTANLRHEASSRFVGTKDPWGTFPSVSAGWRISKEEFLKNVSFLNDLKLRAGYGVTGTAPDDLFLGVSQLGYVDPITNQAITYLINGQWIYGLRPISNPNPSLKWEVKKEANIGLDFTILKNRVSGTIDYYRRRTNGLLYDYPVPSPPNLYGTTKANVGIMENKGLEALLTFNAVHTNKFTWTSSVNFSTNRNKLVSLSNDLYQTTNNFINVGFTGSPVQTYTHRVEVGKEIGNFYGYKVVDITEDGNWIYEDRNGNRSNVKEEADKKVLGNGLPKYYAGWNNNFSYGKFDLSITMRGAFDYQILNFERMYSEVPGFSLYNQLNSAYDQVFGKAVLNKNILPEYNSYYVENGDFWKIDNITLGYSIKLPSSHFKSARVYASTLNTFTITGYKGIDPEVNRLGLSPGNDDRDKYPTARIYTLGLSLSIN